MMNRNRECVRVSWTRGRRRSRNKDRLEVLVVRRKTMHGQNERRKTRKNPPASLRNSGRSSIREKQENKQIDKMLSRPSLLESRSSKHRKKKLLLEAETQIHTCNDPFALRLHSQSLLFPFWRLICVKRILYLSLMDECLCACVCVCACHVSA